MPLEDYSTSQLLAEIERRKTSNVRKLSPRESLFSDNREGRFWFCETCRAVIDMRNYQGEWFADNHWQHGTLWHYPCYGRVEKLGEPVQYTGAMVSQKTGNHHLLTFNTERRQRRAILRSQ